MKQSTMQWAREAINNIQSNLTTRIREGNLSSRDQQMMANMMTDIQKELENQTEINETIRELYENLEKIRKELSVPTSKETADRIEATASAAGRNLDELEKVNHIANALQLDAQSIIPLLEQLQQKQNEMRQSFQKAVDIDFQLYGKTSSLTERALEAYHFEITPDRQVVEAAAREPEEPVKNNSSRQRESPEPQAPPAAPPGREPYQEGDRIKLKIPNVTPEEKKAIENQLFQAGARYYKGTIPAEESSTGKEVNYTSWYVKYKEGMDLSPFSPYIKGSQNQARKEAAGNIPAPGQEAAAIAAAAQAPPAAPSGREPYQEGDRIKLKIPNVTPEEKKAIENQLFQAGARYYKGTIPAEESSTGKEVNYTSWYVKYKEGMDLSPFSPYIKGSQNQARKEAAGNIPAPGQEAAAIAAAAQAPPAAPPGREPYQEGDRIKLKIPNVTPEEKKAIENQLFQAGARYYKGTIPAEESITGKEVNYTSWYVKYKEGMDLSAFSPYIKGKQQQKPSVLKQLDQNKKEAGGGKEKLQEETEKKSPEMER